jgi:hypothetical protein
MEYNAQDYRALGLFSPSVILKKHKEHKVSENGYLCVLR